MVDIVSPPLVKEEGGGGEHHRELFALLCSYPSLLRVRHFTSCFLKKLSFLLFVVAFVIVRVYGVYRGDTHREPYVL